MTDVQGILAMAEQNPDATNLEIAKVVKRDPETVAKVIKTARAVLGNLAEEYVTSHIEVVRKALANGDAKSLAVAARASEWAIESISEGGERVVDAHKAAPSLPPGPAFQIGIALGGVPAGSHGGGRLKTTDETVDALPAGETAPEDDTP